MKSRVVSIWMLSLAMTLVATAFAFVRLDVPLMIHFWDPRNALRPLGDLLGATVVLTGEAVLLLITVFRRLVSGYLSGFWRTAAIASLSSICSYGVNDAVLKVFCGVPDPRDVVRGMPHRFHILAGSPGDSFPSGHMVLAGAFAGVFMVRYAKSTAVFVPLLLLAAGLLLVGGWHFLSDIIAGGFIGVTAGMLAGMQPDSD